MSLVNQIVVAAALAAPGAFALAEGGNDALGARELTNRVVALAETVEALSASHAQLQAALETRSGELAALQVDHGVLQSALACVAPQSGPGRLVLKGCDFAVERLDDGSEIYGNVEVEGVLQVNAIEARSNAADPRSGELVVGADQSLVLRSGTSSQSLQRNGDIVTSGKDIDIRAAGDVAIKATRRIVLQAAEISQNE
jgi:hypothetical protein